MEFYLGTHRPHWLGSAGFPLFVSHRTLKERKSYPRAIAPWALDSGGFTELSMNGRWETTPEQYVAAVRVYAREVGSLEWAAPQDWMCEPAILAKTGRTVEQHQASTVENFQRLRELAPELPFIPVVQGWDLDDYMRCVSLYAKAGINLATERVVGLGSVCRRQASRDIERLVERISGLGIRLHGFGIKRGGIERYADLLLSADSMAWSLDARVNYPPMAGCLHKNCCNCIRFASWWRERMLRRLDRIQLRMNYVEVV